ncbi:MAG: BamA/TamA family outer membrane protein [Candidatus Eisenbacteria bacterium]|nr:BamA/TamA family outer membrane protein [Candidatus Eisenbacteria bacterium]
MGARTRSRDTRARAGKLLLWAALALGCCAPLGTGVARAAELELGGWPLAAREGAALFAPALAQPGDSVALSRALGVALARLQGEGWLGARATGEWWGTPPRLRARIEPGVRARWAELLLDVPAADSAAWRSEPLVRAGDVARPFQLTRAIEKRVTEAEAAGFAWAQLGVSSWEEDSGRVRVRLSGARGPRVIISDVRLEGMKTTRPEVAERAMGRLRGAPYDPAAVRLATQRLSQLGVFRRAEFAGLAGGGELRQGVLRWRVEEPRFNTFEGAVGVQGDAGVAGLARLELGNLLGTARSVALAWQSRGKGLADFSARYTEPMLFGRALRLQTELRQQVQDTLWTRFRYGARLGAALGEREHIEAGFGEERLSQPQGEVQSADQQETSFALVRDGRDDALAPRRGTRLRLAATQSFKREKLRGSALGVDAPSVTRSARLSGVDVTAEWHGATGRRSGAAVELGAAGRFSSQPTLAEWERFTLGGAASLRGHDEEAFRADRYVVSKLEWRWFLGDRGERVALFWDHAQMESRRAVDALAPDGPSRVTRSSADGVGFGLRLPAAGGHVDLDYGLAPGSGFLDGKVHLRLVTAF